MNLEPFVKSAFAVLSAGVRRQSYSRKKSVALQLSGSDLRNQLVAVHIWHLDIRNQDIRHPFLQYLKSLYRGWSFSDMDAKGKQDCGKQVAGVGIVVNKQNSYPT